MRIVFMGNPEFAVPSLHSLHHKDHDIVTLVTNPDKEQGRGRRARPTPVALFGKERGIPLIQPESLKDEELASELERLNVDIFVVVAFKILPGLLLRIPRLGCVNLHGSILPKYRGAAPIQWALMNGDSVTGLTTFVLAPKVDTGDILLKRRVVIYPDEDFGSLSRRMSLVGAALLTETLDGLASDTLVPGRQDDSKVTKAPKIETGICLIDWKQPALQIRNKIRGLSPVPGAYTTFNGKRLKLYHTMVSARTPTAPGEIESVGKGDFLVSCGKDCIRVLEVQLEGKRRMSAREFLAGSSLSPGGKLGGQ